MAAAHRQEFIDDISEVCRIRSVSIMNKQDPEKPFGAACRQMLDKALEMSGRYGFETRNYDNFCGSAVYGSNPDNDSIGIFSHMDIVPEGEGWTHDPFDRFSPRTANTYLPAVLRITNPAALWPCMPCAI